MTANISSAFDLDIFRPNKQTVDVQKIVFKLWESRGNAQALNDLSEVLCKFMDEKKVFTEIEFYLPQIVHLIIHMDQHIQSPGLECLATYICQTSMHCALQFSFMLIAAMEDYQPEIANNKKNPTANAFYFARCARLLQDVERAVIYDSPNLSSSEYNTWKNRAVGLSQDARTFKRAELSHQLSVDIPNSVDSVLNGMLYFKRVERKSMLHTKQWHQRYFVVDQRVLLCFNDKDAVTPKRAISLQNCEVIVNDTHPKYGDTCFEVVNEANGIQYFLRTEDAATRSKWVEFLNREISGAPILSSTTATSSDSPASSVVQSRKVVHTTPSDMQNQLLHEADMNATQRRRFRYFQQMRIFVTNMTNICERLRFKERDVRKYFLKHDMGEIYIPPFAYLPLCNSVDEFYCIRKTLPRECHAFTTKARVPALMMFELERHPRSLDVATFLSAELELHADSNIHQCDDQFRANYAGTHGEHTTLDAAVAATGDNDAEDAQIISLPSAFVDVVEADGIIVSSSFDAPLGSVSKSGKRCYWSAEGTGLDRLRAATGKNICNTPSRNTDDVSLEFDQESKAILAANVSLPHSGVLGETFAGKAHRLQRNSNFGHLPGWSIGGLIAKSNDDVRQEVFVIQLMTYYQRAFAEANVPVWMHTYKILSTSKSTGLIELIPNSTSLDGLKKSEGYPGKMRLWFEQKFGGIHSNEFKAAIENYIASQAAYSIVTYLLAIKDRHNGNIMIDKDGHIIHIDFGFVFGLAPGKQFSMEKAPWKLNAEFVEVMGGYDSSLFKDYRQRCIQAFNVARRHAKSVLTLMSIMQAHSNYPAFRYNANAIRDFRARLFLDRPDSDLPAIIDQLISRSYKATGTDLYDQFQLATNGIAI